MAQTSTHDSEADLLEALLRSDKALVAIKMPDTTLIALNDAAVALWGITADEAVGRHASILFHGSDEVHSNIALAALASGAVQSYSARRRVRGRTDLDVWTCVKSLDVDGHSVAVGLALPIDHPPPDLIDHEVNGASEGDRTAPIDRGSVSRSRPASPSGGSAVFSTMDQLSAREREVVAALLQGKRTATIAREMFVSTSTIRSHLSSIFKAFRVRSQTELVALLRSHASQH